MSSELEHPCDLKHVQRLLAEECTPEEESQIVQHLDGCAKCRSEMEGLAGCENWWREVRTRLSTDFDTYRSTSLDLEHFDARSSSSAKDNSIGWTKKLLEQLGPTDDPRMLGRLGAYEVLAVIGRGGTGIVLKALDARLNRYVAIKVLSPGIAQNGTAIKRFEREGRAIAAVAHAHVVPVHSVDEYQGLPFIVMQFVGGDSLQQRINHSGPLAVREVVRVGMQIAAGLSAAHAQGVVHRDIKPANVLLENGVERVLVTDFGLATVADDVAMTRTGVIAGTPQYMSPEQARGEAVDELSDLFSLGSVMYAASTGRPPFRAETVYGAIQSICHDAPRSIRELYPETPEWLERFIMRLLSKPKEHRFSSAEEVRRLLSEELAHLQNPKSAAEPTRNWLTLDTAERKRSRAIGAYVVASALAAAFVLAAIFGPQGDTHEESGQKEKALGAVVEQSKDNDSVPAEKQVHIAGRVVDPNGNAVEAAELYIAPFTTVMHHTGIPKTSFTPLQKRNHILGRSDEGGQFAVSVAEADRDQGLSLVAAAKGFGPAWVALNDLDDSGEIRLALTDDIPVRGRIISSDGRPVANATIRVRGIYRPAEPNLDLWLEWVAKHPDERFWTLTPRSVLSINSVAPSIVESDDEGNFTVPGIGAERIAELVVEGNGIAKEAILVATRKGELPPMPRGVYGVEPVHVASPGRTITGTVREKDTGTTLSGATVMCRNTECWTVTDDNGRYVLDGVPKRGSYRIGAGHLLPYFFAVKETNDSTAKELRVDFELEKGIVLRGQVTEKETGKPVRVVIRYGVDADKPTADLYPAARDRFSVEYFTGGFVTDAIGRFEFAVAQTPGVVTARPLHGNYAFARAISDQAGDGNGHRHDNLGLGGAHVFYGDVAAVKAIDPKPKQPASLQCDLELRGGRSLQGTVLDPKREELTGAHVVGLNAIYDGRADYLHTAKFRIGGLVPNRKRTVVFLHRKRNFATAIEVSYATKGPLTAELKPMASIRAKVIDENGQPLTQGTVWIRESRKQRAALPFGFVDPESTGFRGFGREEVFPKLTLNENGSVEFGKLIPGLAYTVSYISNDGRPTVLATDLRAISGQLHDLGSIESRSSR